MGQHDHGHDFHRLRDGVCSRTFGEIALAYTSQGVMWKKLLGEKWAPVVVKYLFSLVSIAAGVWVIYAGIYGYD
jgi:hypothetical protein